MSDLMLLLFDIDGTIVDSEKMIVSVMQQSFQDWDLPVPERKAIHYVVGLSLEIAVHHLAPQLTESQAHDLAEHYRSVFRAKADKDYLEPLYDGAAELLRDLGKSEFLIGAATGKPRRGLDRVLTGHGLDHLFLTKQTADVAQSKPNPDMIFRAAQETGTDPANILMIGDTGHDMRMAKNAGAQAIGVTWGYHTTAQLQDGGADILVKDFRELRSVIDHVGHGASIDAF